ncbi:MAG: hypothetical protein IJX12_06035 [Lachnospiraceae bacterium]|nr:hypothetical protein [Lachnospiraceae bacterium]
MRKLLVLLFLLPIFTYCASGDLCRAEEQETSGYDQDFEMLLQAICECDLEDGESIIVGEKYVISCEEGEVELPSKERNAYSVTKSDWKTFKVTENGTEKPVFTLTQYVTAVYNTYTESVRIDSHTVTFTANDTSYRLISSTQVATIGVWNEFAAPGRIEVVVGQGSSRGMAIASVTVFQSGEVTFRFSQAW